MVSRRLAVLTLLIPGIAVLGGCGGSSSPTAPSGGTNRLVEAQAVALELSELINRDRAQNNLPALTWDEGLAGVALSHTQWMASEGILSHEDASGNMVGDRLRLAGIAYRSVAENVGSGPSAAALHAGFMGSPSHRENILDRDFTRYGIACIWDGTVYWVTQIFIRP